MSMTDEEIEIKVFLGSTGKNASRKEIFSKIYKTTEISKISDDIRCFLRDYRRDLAVVVERKSKSLAKEAAPRPKYAKSETSQIILEKDEQHEIKTPSNGELSQGIEKKRELKFVSAGGCHGVEASAHLLTMDGHNILLDAGYSEKNTIALDLIRKRKPEAVFITHAHLDHIGSLPIVHRIFPRIPIYMTPATKTLAYTILNDSMNVASLKGNDLFSNEEIERTLESVITVDFDQEFDFKNLKVIFRCAGHILGAAYVIIEGSSRVLYTGDISNSKFLTTPSAYMPKQKESVDLLISESTYGSTSNVDSREKQVAKFCSEVSAVIERGGRVLIPSFALGRAQEVLTILLNEMNKGNLRKVQVVLDGMARTIAERYDDYSDYMPSRIYRECRRSECLRHVSDSENRERVAGNREPCVIIASSGMLTGGPSVAYAKEVLTEEKSAIFIVGYVDEEAPGRQLANSKLGEEIELVSEDGTKVDVTRRCEVKKYRLSAHSDQKELVNFSIAYEPATVFLVHGEARAKVPLAKTLLRSNISPVFIPENLEEIDVERLLRLWTEIKIALTEREHPKQELNVIYEKAIDNLHDKGKKITFEDLTDAIENAKLLRHCGSPKGARQTLYYLFGWSLKYSRRTEGLDFEFPGRILQNGTLLLQTLYGKGFGRRFLSELERNVPLMFKNFIMHGGPIATRKFFKVNITSKGQLQFSLDNFQANLANLGIHSPTISDIQRVCQDYASRVPQAKGEYLGIFEEPPKEIRRAEKIEELPARQIEDKIQHPKIISPIAKRSKHKKEKKSVPQAVIAEGLIGLGSKYGEASLAKKTETQKTILEIRETFSTTERRCTFCGSKNLELLKVSNPDPKTSRSEYRCTDCKLVFAVRSPNL